MFATAGIGALGFSVRAHHKFTTGSVYLPFFSLMTFLIAIPTGVKMFNWTSRCGGATDVSTPMIFAIGSLTMFLLGGINGAFSASVPVDFALHDTYFVVSAASTTCSSADLFGIMAGFYYWFPKMTGRMLNETLGKVQFVLIFIGSKDGPLGLDDSRCGDCRRVPAGSPTVASRFRSFQPAVERSRRCAGACRPGPACASGRMSG